MPLYCNQPERTCQKSVRRGVTVSVKEVYSAPVAEGKTFPALHAGQRVSLCCHYIIKKSFLPKKRSLPPLANKYPSRQGTPSFPLLVCAPLSPFLLCFFGSSSSFLGGANANSPFRLHSSQFPLFFLLSVAGQTKKRRRQKRRRKESRELFYILLLLSFSLSPFLLREGRRPLVGEKKMEGTLMRLWRRKEKGREEGENLIFLGLRAKMSRLHKAIFILVWKPPSMRRA